MSPHLVLASVLITGPLTSIDFTGYAGEGLVPSPDAGQLDSDAWRVSGMNDGDTAFGGTYDDGDHAEGASAGGITAGGLWSFEVAPDDTAFGFQQTSDDLTPGRIVVRFVNATSDTIESPSIRFDVWIFNDSGRSSELEFAYSVGGDLFETLNGQRATSIEGADPDPVWVRLPREVPLPGVAIAPGEELHLRWSPDDNGGSGGYDELAIDDIQVEYGTGGGGEDPAPDAGADDTPAPDAGVEEGGADAAPVDDNPGDDGGYAAGCDAGGGGGGIALVVVMLAAVIVRRRPRESAPL